MTQTQSLMTDIEAHFQTAGIGQPIRYISADEMAHLKARAHVLRAEASRGALVATATWIAGLFHSRPAEWSAPAGAITAK
jgi:hypothetical protein